MLFSDSFENLPDRLVSLKNLYQPHGVTLDVLRLDELHPVVSGNKWFKLKEYLKEAVAQNSTSVLTFGGAYSNHIVATAAACQAAGLRCTGFIRGEAGRVRSPTLVDAEALGMELHFLSREAYRAKEVPHKFREGLSSGSAYLISEGGYGQLGKKGAGSILHFPGAGTYTHICAALGTGTTLAGLIESAGTGQQVLGFSALKGFEEAEGQVRTLVQRVDIPSFQVLHSYHFGGYAKRTPELTRFMNDWYRQTGIPSDFVYTGKLFYGVDHLVRTSFFRPGSRILVIHSGGLQGNRSLPKGTLIF